MKKYAVFVFKCIGIIILLLFVNYATYTIYAGQFIVDGISGFRNTNLLVLGAGNSPKSDLQNPRFTGRMKTTLLLAPLIKSGHIILSGKVDNKFYNEPHHMVKYLLKKKIDGSLLVKDKKGSNTFLSVKNYKTTYGNSCVVIITQKMHLSRALFIARCMGIEAYGYIAPPPTDEAVWFFYELFARAKSTCVLLHYFATR